MIVSRQVQEWQAEARIKGRAEGEITTRIDSIVMTLESRFGNVTPEVLQAVRAILDPERLRQLFDVALHAASLADVLAHLDSP